MAVNLFGGLRRAVGANVGALGGAVSAITGGLFCEGLRSAGGQLSGGQRSFNLVPTAQAASPAPQTLGAQTTGQPSGGGFGALLNQPTQQRPAGGGGGGQIQPQQPGGGGQPTESAPGEPQFDFGALNEALGALGSLEEETRSLLGGGEQQAEQFRSAAEATAKGEKARGGAAVSEQERKTQVAGREAETQQRRGFSE
ncbi:MAG: hypothetical protein AAB907_02400, partial [Patescibacteria group bacterium]